MLPIAVVEEIARLVGEGNLSQRKIAARLGVSRGVVSEIASGRRGMHGREPELSTSAVNPQGPAVRCAGCGYRVYLPCQICKARRLALSRNLLRIFREEKTVSGLAGRIERPGAGTTFELRKRGDRSPAGSAFPSPGGLRRRSRAS